MASNELPSDVLPTFTVVHKVKGTPTTCTASSATKRSPRSKYYRFEAGEWCLKAIIKHRDILDVRVEHRKAKKIEGVLCTKSYRKLLEKKFDGLHITGRQFGKVMPRCICGKSYCPQCANKDNDDSLPSKEVLYM